jgi:hypothetical protein
MKRSSAQQKISSNLAPDPEERVAIYSMPDLPLA